jgi:hypothetical protein
MDPVSDPCASPLASRDVLWVTALVFLGAALLLRLAYARFPVLYDADNYYHLAVARAYGERGMLHALDWARFSIMRDGFGDKEFLLTNCWLLLGEPACFDAAGQSPRFPREEGGLERTSWYFFFPLSRDCDHRPDERIFRL